MDKPKLDRKTSERAININIVLNVAAPEVRPMGPERRKARGEMMAAMMAAGADSPFALAKDRVVPSPG